jgi:flagellar biosynthesis protein
MIKKKDQVKEAAALRYSPEKGGAPEVVALGKGEVAERIIEKANENNVPLYEDAGLAHALNLLNLGDEIPRELYEVIAQVLVFVSHLDGSYDGTAVKGGYRE